MGQYDDGTWVGSIEIGCSDIGDRNSAEAS
jgi:hypothetical protein